MKESPGTIHYSPIKESISPDLKRTLEDLCRGTIRVEGVERAFETVVSKGSSIQNPDTSEILPENMGMHFILQFVGMPDREEVNYKERDALIGLASTKIAPMLAKHFVSGEYRVMENGPGMATQKHDHIHIVCFNKSKLQELGLAPERYVDSVLKRIS